MPSKLPYMIAPGLISKILEKIQQARRPERFTQDFLGTKLGHSGGSAMPIIPLLKKMGFLSSDGSPTPRYDHFRNEDTRGMSVAEGLKAAYSELFERNEYVYELTRDKLTSLVVETTGAAKSDRTTKAIVGTFATINALADFEAEPSHQGSMKQALEEVERPAVSLPIEFGSKAMTAAAENVDFKVSYTINLNLPETTDPDVFNAIFRSLKEHLLKE